MDQVNPPAQQMFQQLLFSKIVPNCKKLGLLDARRRLAARALHRDRRDPVRGLGRHRRGVRRARRGREDRQTASRARRLPHRDDERRSTNALFAAADRGHALRRSGPSSCPTGSRSAPDVRRPHVRRGRRQRQPARARVAGARRRRRATGSRCCAANRPEFVEASSTAQRAGLRLTTINWHLTGDEAGYIVDDCEATAFVADARFADAAVGAADAARRRSKARIAVGGDIDGFERCDDVLAREDGDATRRPGARRHDALHVGHDRPPKGVRRDTESRARALDVATADRATTPRQHVHLCTGPLYHAAPLAFSLVGARRDRRADRADGRLGRGGDAAR